MILCLSCYYINIFLLSYSYNIVRGNAAKIHLYNLCSEIKHDAWYEMCLENHIKFVELVKHRGAIKKKKKTTPKKHDILGHSKLPNPFNLYHN